MLLHTAVPLQVDQIRLAYRMKYPFPKYFTTRKDITPKRYATANLSFISFQSIWLRNIFGKLSGRGSHPYWQNFINLISIVPRSIYGIMDTVWRMINGLDAITWPSTPFSSWSLIKNIMVHPGESLTLILFWFIQVRATDCTSLLVSRSKSFLDRKHDMNKLNFKE